MADSKSSSPSSEKDWPDNTHTISQPPEIQMKISGSLSDLIESYELSREGQQLSVQIPNKPIMYKPQMMPAFNRAKVFFQSQANIVASIASQRSNSDNLDAFLESGEESCDQSESNYPQGFKPPPKEILKDVQFSPSIIINRFGIVPQMTESIEIVRQERQDSLELSVIQQSSQREDKEIQNSIPGMPLLRLPTDLIEEDEFGDFEQAQEIGTKEEINEVINEEINEVINEVINGGINGGINERSNLQQLKPQAREFVSRLPDYGFLFQKSFLD